MLISLSLLTELCGGNTAAAEKLHHVRYHYSVCLLSVVGAVRAVFFSQYPVGFFPPFTEKTSTQPLDCVDTSNGVFLLLRVYFPMNVNCLRCFGVLVKFLPCDRELSLYCW